MQLVFLLLSTFTCLAAPVISEIRDGQPLPCSQPLVRREWRALSIKERARWLRAVKCLASTPQRPRLPSWRFQSAYKYPRRLFASAYDDFSWIHVDMFEYIHDGNLFLPWHRAFLHLFETALREECGYTDPSPYWDWTRDALDITRSGMWDPHPEHGLGSNGALEHGHTVLDGAFASTITPNFSQSAPPTSSFSQLRPPPFFLRYPVPHFLWRNFTLHTIDHKNNLTLEEVIPPSNVERLVRLPGADEFFYDMEASHNVLHKFIGGDLEGKCPEPVDGFGDYSDNDDDVLAEERYRLWKGEKGHHACEGGFTVNDPIFWLHHAQVDRIWSRWQGASRKNFWAIGGNITTEQVMYFDGMAKPIRVSQVINTTAGLLCYIYE